MDSGSLPGDSKGLPGQGTAGGPLTPGSPHRLPAGQGPQGPPQRVPSGGYKHPGTMGHVQTHGRWGAPISATEQTPKRGTLRVCPKVRCRGGARQVQGAYFLFHRLTSKASPLSDVIFSEEHIIAHLVKNLPIMQETWLRFLGREDPLERGMATHASILAWRIPWTVACQAPLLMGLQESDMA